MPSACQSTTAVCSMGGCDTGFKNLNKSVSDGCEYRCPVWPALTAEVCNGKDDDCDKQVDEDIAAVGKVCDTGKKGICKPGKMSCQGGTSVCVPDATSSTENPALPRVRTSSSVWPRSRVSTSRSTRTVPTGTS